LLFDKTVQYNVHFACGESPGYQLSVEIYKTQFVLAVLKL
jgi:hypothetical protein